MNETPNAVPGDNFDADIDSGYEKNFHNGLCDYDNESLYRPIVTLYLRKLLRKILLTILLKIPNHMVEVMFALMVLLLVLKVVQSGVHHTCDGGHA